MPVSLVRAITDRRHKNFTLFIKSPRHRCRNDAGRQESCFGGWPMSIHIHCNTCLHKCIPSQLATQTLRKIISKKSNKRSQKNYTWTKNKPVIKPQQSTVTHRCIYCWCKIQLSKVSVFTMNKRTPLNVLQQSETPVHCKVQQKSKTIWPDTVPDVTMHDTKIFFLSHMASLA